MKNKEQKALKELKEHYQELYEVAVKEHQFGLLCVEHLKSVLNEIKVLDDKLYGLIAENGLNRHEIDKVIHAKTLFKEGHKHCKECKCLIRLY